jgi:hypothetical protein
MSRTYRLRHIKSSVAHKFTNSGCTLHMAKVKEDITYFIAHIIFNQPCKQIGKQIVTLEKSKWYGTDIHKVNHLRCLPRGWWPDVWDPWLHRLVGAFKYNIAPIWKCEHKFRNRRRKGHWNSHKHDLRAEKRRHKILNQYMVKTNDLDAIQPRHSGRQRDD